MIPKLQSKANIDFLYLSGKRDVLPEMKLVGEPWPMFKIAGKLSAKVGNQVLLPVLHPYSAPLVTCMIRVGLYQGVPKSHSISESYAKSSSSSLKVMSKVFLKPAATSSQVCPS